MNRSKVVIDGRVFSLPQAEKHGFGAYALLTVGLVVATVLAVFLFLLMSIVF